MDKDFINIIGHEKEEFHPEKFNTDFNFVGNILARANELKFNFNRYKETSADQLFMSCLCYVANNISRSRAFNMDLYGSDYMPPEIKFRIYEKWQKDSSFEPPKTLSDAFVQVYSPSEVSAYVSNILKISKEEHSSLLTPHVTFDHDRQITIDKMNCILSGKKKKEYTETIDNINSEDVFQLLDGFSTGSPSMILVANSIRLIFKTLLTNGKERLARRLHSITLMSLSLARNCILKGPLMCNSLAICLEIFFMRRAVST